MNLELILIIFIFYAYFLFFKKFSLLNENSNISHHKSFIKNKKKPILIGGIFIITIIILFSNFIFFPVKLSLLLIFLLGLSSDKNIFPNPKIRLIVQLLIIMYVISFYDLKILDLRIEFANDILSNSLFNYLFTIFCIAILINGSNFIDGLNGLLIGYIILVLVSLLFVTANFSGLSLIDKEFIIILLFSLLILFFMNLRGFVFLGDSGSYLLSFYLGIYLIIFFMNNQFVSPYYIAAILWYPSFENFFSFLRRINSKKSVSSADNRHLHQLLYAYILNSKRFNSYSKYPNSYCAVLILVFNIPGIFFSSMIPFNTGGQILIILINVSLYLFFYFLLSKKFTLK